MTTRTAVGVVGCGTISGLYLSHLASFPWIEVTACADLDLDRAKARATEFDVPRACSTGELLADPDIEIVVNLTVPAAHFEVAMAAVDAGKSVYNEKPLCATSTEAKSVLDAAVSRGVLVGAAPDTFLGRAGQAARRVVDEGTLGTLVGGAAFFTGRGHELWHGDPAFYYKAGAGPLFDMGPYYLTALVHLLGPIASVTGMAETTWATRTIQSAPKRGEVIDVETPTHIAAALEFRCGALVTMLTSFDIWNTSLPRVEVYGGDASLSLADPNTFDGPVRVWQGGGTVWEDVNTVDGYLGNRGVGVADLALALREHREPRASGALGLHVLEAMEAILASADARTHTTLETTCDRPDPLAWPMGDS